VRSEVTEHRSGAVSATLRTQGRVAVIDGATTGEWGASFDPDPAAGFTGHDLAAADPAALLSQLQQHLADGRTA